jgi:hypothetical protein
MAEINYETDQFHNYAARGVQQSYMTRLMLSTGIVKTERGAQNALLIIAIIVGAIAIYMLIPAPAPDPTGPSPIDLIRQRQI